MVSLDKDFSKCMIPNSVTNTPTAWYVHSIPKLGNWRELVSVGNAAPLGPQFWERDSYCSNRTHNPAHDHLTCINWEDWSREPPPSMPRVNTSSSVGIPSTHGPVHTSPIFPLVWHTLFILLYCAVVNCLWHYCLVMFHTYPISSSPSACFRQSDEIALLVANFSSLSPRISNIPVYTTPYSMIDLNDPITQKF